MRLKKAKNVWVILSFQLNTLFKSISIDDNAAQIGRICNLEIEKRNTSCICS